MAGIGIDTSAASKAASPTSTKANNSSLDKDAFLKLLVAQMQYQDPLEPTSNTEYMSQLAQFSTVEELQNLATSFTNSQSLNLVGQYVILNVPDAKGNITQVSGLVDYVTMADGKTFLHVNDEYYPSEYLDSVVSIDYLEHLINSMKPEADGTEGADKTEDGDDNSGDGGDNNNSDGADGADKTE